MLLFSCQTTQPYTDYLLKVWSTHYAIKSCHPKTISTQIFIKIPITHKGIKYAHWHTPTQNNKNKNEDK